MRRLAVFSGGFTVEAAEAVGGLGAETLDALSTLLEHGLLKRVDGPGDAPRSVPSPVHPASTSVPPSTQSAPMSARVAMARTREPPELFCKTTTR